jgi:tetratricopeptide (TPR) repeat protein/DNA-binding XRE family transcriptional regulator
MAGPEHPSYAFGDVLRAHRVTARLTQEELAERARLSVRAIADLERGRTARPRPNSVQRLAAALELTESALEQFRLAARGWPAAAATLTALPGERSGSGNRVMPRMLPAAVPAFAGRHSELAVLSRMLDQPGGMAVITAIGGTAGVGKTALAIYWGHRVAAEFPDGQLFVNLRGFDPSGTPVAPADVMPILLEALGVPPDRIPEAFDGQAGLYRSLLAGRRMLIVLDNANDEAQVRPLLPGSLTCRVVVTSRNELTGLAAIEAARLLLLDVMTDTEARELLRLRLGPELLAADSSATTQIIEACAHLPLALSIIAARVASAPGLSFTRVASEIAGSPDLGGFAAGRDPAADVRAVLSWSYRCLNPDAARAFRLAGLHPGPYLDRYAIAALTQTVPEQAGQLLTMLAHGHLVQPAGPDRYRMHDLLKGYARVLAEVHDAEGDRRYALTRLFDYYLHTAAAAMNALVPAERHLRPAIPQAATPAPPVSPATAARTWLDTERASLVAVAAHASGHGWPSHAIWLSATLFRYLDTGSHHPEAVAIHTCARRAARAANDLAGEARALNGLGSIAWRQGRYPQATDYYEQALALFRQIGDQTGEAQTLGNLGIIAWRQGRHSLATDYYEQALALFRQAGDRTGEARTLGNLGVIEERQGRYMVAADHYQQILALFRQAGDLTGQARSLTNLGSVEGRQRRYPEATSYLEEALALFRQAGDRTGQAHALTNLGSVEERQHRYPEATSYLEQALALRRETGDRAGEAEVLNTLGEVALATSEPNRARAKYAAALDLASQTGDKYQQAHAHHGLGSVYDYLSDPGRARVHWEQALSRYASLGTPEADVVRARLAEDTFR